MRLRKPAPISPLRSASSLPRVLLLAAIALATAALAVIQFGSEALYAQPGSLSSALPHSLGVSMYLAFERIAPLPFVEESLSQDALEHGDLDAASTHAQRLPDGVRRDDLLGRIAQERGNVAAASEYYYNAVDTDRMQAIIQAQAKTNKPAAIALELRFCRRLQDLKTHPDALGDCYFDAADMLDSIGRKAAAQGLYLQSVALAPLNGRYMDAAASESLKLGDIARAKAMFQQAVSANPANADALAGLGLVALREGNRALAQRYAARARATKTDSVIRPTLEKLLR